MQFIVLQCKRQLGDAVIKAVALQQEVYWFGLGSLQVLCLPVSVQITACKVNLRLNCLKFRLQVRTVAGPAMNW